MTDQHVGEPQDAPEDQIHDGNVDQLMPEAPDDGQTAGSRRRPKGLIVAGVAAVAALGTGAVIALIAGGTPAVQAAHEAADPVGDVAMYVEVQDDGETLFIDAPGEEDSGFDDAFTVYDYTERVLEELEAPDYVWTQMGQTRSLDGRQSAGWDGYEVSWSYHPDDGLDVLITTAD